MLTAHQGLGLTRNISESVVSCCRQPVEWLTLRLFITHMHGDHCFGITGVLRAIHAALRAGSPEGAARPDPVYIYGPPGVLAP